MSQYDADKMKDMLKQIERYCNKSDGHAWQ